jgi:hypothetical protein
VANRTPPWWTDADQAELDVAIWALIVALEVVEGPKRGQLIEAVLDWWRMRHLVSKAEWLRGRHLEDRLREIEGPIVVAA